MATRRWTGTAPRVAQVQTYTFAGTWEVGDIIRVKFGLKTWDYSVTSTTIATFLPLFVTAFNALNSADYPEFAEVTASATSPVLTLTADTAGKPFTCSLTPLESNAGAADAQTIEGAGTVTTGTAATACSSPNHWSIAANWLEGAVPVGGDDVVIDAGPSILYGLDQNAVTLATMTITRNFPGTAEIGLPSNTNPQAPASGYPEYRDQRLKIGATICLIETTSRRVRLDLTPAPTTTTVRETGQPATTTERALDLKADNAGGSTALYFLKGNIGLNAIPGDSGTVADVNIGFIASQSSDVNLLGGTGLTLTRLDQGGGDVILQNGVVTVLKTAGTLTIVTGAVTTLTNRGGTVYHDGTGTITTLTNEGVFIRRGFRAGTITTTTLLAGSQTSDANGVITWTNPPNFYECRLAEGPDDRERNVCWANFGVHRKLTVADI
jgi:hypothetical protein